MNSIYFAQKHRAQWEHEKWTWQLHKNTNEKVKEYFPAHMRKLVSYTADPECMLLQYIT